MNMDYYQISAEELGQNAKVPLLKLGDSGEVFYELALEMIGEIEKNGACGLFDEVGGQLIELGARERHVQVLRTGRVRRDVDRKSTRLNSSH